MQTEKLEPVEQEIIEELDAFARLGLSCDLREYCSSTNIEALKYITGYETELKVQPLIDYGYIRIFRGNLTLTAKAKKLVKGVKVFHTTSASGKTKNGRGELCTQENKCSECITANKARELVKQAS